MYDELITSGQNPKIKELLALQEKSRERRRQGLFVVEGRRELEHCLDAGFTPDTIFICPEIFSCHPEARPELVEGRSEGSYPFGDRCKTFHVSHEVYEKIAYRGGTEGIIAEMRFKERKLEDIKLSENPLVIVLESVEKPGNLGAVLRSADAAGADAVIICDPLTDLYNPNLIRASIGAIFSRQVAAASSEETIAWLKKNNIQILTAQLQDSSLYYDTPMTGPTAIVMGTESTGLTDIWRKAADKHIRIPMLGALDSLNVSVSAAILLFEAVRQRSGCFTEVPGL
ncbi:MAG: RNA methyltransferase [Bacteroidales bacterium]|nr:RNA methyltransferase [Bacteroidales bacterium]